MRYTAKELMPKHLPKSMVCDHLLYWMISKRAGIVKGYLCNYTSDDWFIDVSGAPDELKPLSYPEYKPSKSGWYWVYNQALDKWKLSFWSDEIHNYWYAVIVDYFIPYRLDEPSSNPCELKEDDVSVSEPVICFEKKREIALITQYLDKKGYDVTKREPELLLCPFCGGERCKIKGHSRERYYVWCNDCYYRSPKCDTRLIAVCLHNALPRKGEK